MNHLLKQLFGNIPDIQTFSDRADLVYTISTKKNILVCCLKCYQSQQPLKTLWIA